MQRCFPFKATSNASLKPSISLLEGNVFIQKFIYESAIQPAAALAAPVSGHATGSQQSAAEYRVKESRRATYLEGVAARRHSTPRREGVAKSESGDGGKLKIEIWKLKWGIRASTQILYIYLGVVL